MRYCSDRKLLSLIFAGFAALILLSFLAGSTAEASGVNIEKNLQGAFFQSKAVVQRIVGKLKTGKPTAGELHKLKKLAGQIRNADTLLQAKFRVRKEELKTRGPKARERHRAMEEGYRKALQQYLGIIDSLPPNGKVEQSAIEDLKALLEKILPKKNRQIFGVLPYGNLNYPPVQPGQTPDIVPAYKGGNKAVGPDDTNSTEEAPITEEIASLAQSLNWNPVSIYEYVKNNIETEWYWGCMKGAEETLHQKSGNDCDQATLLTALLRAAGFPSRYVRGTIEFFPGIDKAKNLTGIDDPSNMARFFQKAGIPHSPVISGGTISNFRIEHIWVDSQIPYDNYRGATIDDQGKTWLGLDTSIKVKGYTYNSPTDVFQQPGVSEQLSGARDGYLSAVQTRTPLEYVEAMLTAGGYQSADIMTTRTMVSDVMNILPASMQFQQIHITNEYTEIPDELRHKVRFTASDKNGNHLFTTTFDAMELSNKKITMRYEPETVEDQQIIESYGGLDNTPAYLVRLRPVLEINGEMAAAGDDGLPMGEEHDLTIDLISPSSTETITSTMITGNVVALGIVAQKAISAQSSADSSQLTADSLLHNEAINYIDRWNRAEDELSSILHLAVARPIPTVVMVGGVIDVTYVLDTPHGYEWKGVYVDASKRAVEVIPLTQGAETDRKKTFMQLSALDGSILENRLFEDDFQVDSISTAKLIQTANASQIPVITVDNSNASSVLPTLSFDENVVDDITNSINQNLTVFVPQTAITYNDWTGIGYTKEDPATGEAGYMLTGMIAGGETAITPEEWVNQYLVDTLRNPYSNLRNEDPQATEKIIKIPTTDRQFGTVGKPLSQPLAVLVLDKNDIPVAGASVTFTVIAGGGDFGNSSTILTVQTAETGIAKAVVMNNSVAVSQFTLGKYTSANPVYQKNDASDKNATRMGLNLVTASVSISSVAVSLQQSFEAYGAPDKPSNIRKVLGDGNKTLVNNPAGSLVASVQDQYGNPVSNVDLTFAALPAVSNEPSAPLPANYRNIEFYDAAGCSNPYPLYGECAAYLSSVTVTTDYYGAKVDTVLGNTVNTKYAIAVSAASLPQVSFNLDSSGFRGSNDYIPPGVYIRYLYPANEKGEPVNAAKAGTALKVPLTSELFMLYDDYSLVSCGPDCWSLKSSGIVNTRPITDGTVTYNVTKGGGTASATTNLNNGKYQAGYTTGADPMVNQISASGSATVVVPEVLFDLTSVYCTSLLPGFSGDPVAGTYNPACTTAITTYSRDQLDCSSGACDFRKRTVSLESGQQAVFQKDVLANIISSIAGIQQTADYTIYGVDIQVTLQPGLTVVDGAGHSKLDTTVNYTILPPDYRAATTDVDFYQAVDSNSESWVGDMTGDATQGSGEVTLAKGTLFAPGKQYETQAVLNSGTDVEIRSSKTPVPLLYDSSPFRVTLDRTHYVSQFNSSIPLTIGDLYKDSYKTFGFYVPTGSAVSLAILDAAFSRKQTVVQQSNLSQGSYYFVVDYQSIANFGFSALTSPDFFLQLSIVPNDGSPSQSMIYPGELQEKVEGKMLGQVIVHDVLIQDGSLNLSRQDVALKGRGPQFEFIRSYNNQSSGSGFKPMGEGWSHSLDLKLQPISTMENGIDAVPDWVNSLKGRFYQASDVPSDIPRWTMVQVNGTVFIKYNGAWYAQRGRHGSLEETTDSFVYTSKDGTRYTYAYPESPEFPTYVQKIEDRNGNEMTFSYVSNRLDKVVDAVGRTFTFGYKDLGGAVGQDNARLQTVSGPDGIELDFTYDDRGYLTSARRGDRLETYEYEIEQGMPAGITPNLSSGDYNLVRATDSNNNSYTYDYFGPNEVDSALVNYTRVLKSQDVIRTVTYPDGSAAAFQYTAQPLNIRTVKGLRDFDTVYTLNNYGNPLSISEPLGKITGMTWSIDEGKDDDVMSSKTDALDNTTTYQYDLMGNVTRETDPYGNSISASWNQYSLPESRTDRNGVSQGWQYDGSGNLLVYIDGDNNETFYSYYPTGERKSMIDPRGNTTGYAYDQYGNPATVTGPEGSVTTYEFDVRGRRISLTDANGNETRYTYDNLDYPDSIVHPRITAYSLPSGSSNLETFRYDPVGNLLSETNLDGLTETYTYTPRNQVATITRDIGGEKTFSYDQNGNILSETDWRGSAVTHTYDELNRRVSTTNRLGYSMSMFYDLNGNLTETADYEGSVTDYGYDKLNRQTDIWQPALDGQTHGNIHRTYYNEGDSKTNLKTETDQEGNATSYKYNGRYLKTRRTDALGNVYSWDYDEAGNLSSETDENGHTTDYRYDGQNRRTMMSKTASGNDIVTRYAYDPAGNQTELTDPRGKITQTAYDEWNRASKIVDPDNYSVTTEYDGEGNKVRTTDGNGNVRAWLRDSLGRVLQATDAEGNPTTYTYDGNNNVLTVTDANGTVTHNTYDAEDRLLTTTEASGAEEQRTKAVLSRDKMGNLLEVQDYKGNITTTVYNALYLPWRVYDPAPFNANFTETTYFKTGKVKAVTNRRGYTTTHAYDALNREVTLTDAKSQTIKTTYDSAGNVLTVTDKRGIVRENSYDELNRLLTTKRAGLLILTNEYDAAGNVTAVTDANGNRTEKTYDNRNLPDTTTFADGTTEKRTYDGVHNLITLTNEENKVTTYTYDRENRETSAEFEGEKTSKTYDALGNLTAITRPMGNVRQMEYDRLKRLIGVVDDPGGLDLATEYEYDTNGNLLHQYDARGNDVELQYDSLNRKTKHIEHKSAGDLTTQHSYDPEGNLSSLTDAKGRQFTYAYDELNRQTDETLPDVATPFMTLKSIHTDYDSNNNVTAITETKSNAIDSSIVKDVTSNTYDDFDRLLTSTERGLTLTYTYDDNGNRKSASTAAGSTAYTFDSRNRISTAVADGLTTGYTYYRDGKKNTISYPNGAGVKYTYFPDNRIQNVTNAAGTSVISSYDYMYDRNGNRLTQTENQTGTIETTAYDYDAVDRLKDFTVTGSDTTVTSYTFEGYNRKTEKVTQNGTVIKDASYTYDESDWLTKVDDSIQHSAVTYAYDNNGNMTLKSFSSLPGADITFIYDSRNKLVETLRGPPESQTILGLYDYNAAGLRIRHLMSERGDVDYFYDGKAVIEEHNASDGSLLAFYRYGDRLLSLFTIHDSPVTEYYHFDALGSTVNLSNSSGGLDTSYKLDPWGHIRLQVGTSLNRHIFTGKEYDPNTGLVYFGARFYDPDTSRFITEDSYLGESDIPPSLNRCLYAYSNPTVYVDLDGYESIIPFLENKKPLDALEWGQGQFREEARRFSDELSDEESRYMEHFKMSSTDPLRLSAEQLRRAKELFGNSKDSNILYAHWNDRSQIINHYKITHPATRQALMGLYRFSRDMNPIHFAAERGWQVESGEEMFTGEKVSRIQSGFEFIAYLAFLKASNIAIGRAKPELTTEYRSGSTSTNVKKRDLSSPVRWVDEGGNLREGKSPGMPKKAYEYQSSVRGARSNPVSGRSQVPQIEYTDANGQRSFVKFDGEEGNTLIDRKTAIHFGAKTRQLAKRQSTALAEHGLTGRWEVPNATEAARATKLLGQEGITNIEVRIIPQ